MAEKKIGKNMYSVEPMLATEALKLAGKIIKTVGPGLTDLTAAFKTAKTDDGDSDLKAIAALQKIMAAMDTDEAIDLMVDLCERAEVKGADGYDAVIFDHQFASKKNEAMQLLWFVLQENFSDFFPEIQAVGKRLKAKAG